MSKAFFKNVKSLMLIVSSVGLSLISCVQGDLYELYDEFDPDMDSSLIKRTKFGVDCWYYIPDNLRNTTGCVYKSIKYVVGNSYTTDEIKTAMRHYSTNVESFPGCYIAPSISRLTNKVVISLTSEIPGSVSIGDIICVPPKCFNGEQMRAGHTTVVTEVVVNEHFTYVKCYDGCEFDVLEITRLVKTSEL